MKRQFPTWICISSVTALMALAALAQYWMGRKLWGIGGIPGVWSGDIDSAQNSQFIADPYTFTHILHGIMFYAILALVFRKWPPKMRLIIAAELQAAWEVVENSDYVINRYRA